MVIKYIFENDVSYDTDVSVLNFAKIFILILIVLLCVSVHLISFFERKYSMKQTNCSVYFDVCRSIFLIKTIRLTKQMTRSLIIIA